MFPLQRIGKGCSHNNERQIREVGTLGDSDLYTVSPKPTSGRERLQVRHWLLDSRVEAGSNTSTMTLRVVGGDETDVSNLRQ
jgi:hypothetical protein